MNLPAMQKSLNMRERLLRIAGYFNKPYYAWATLAASVILGAALEPAIPAMLQPLLDEGFNAKTLPLWKIPVAFVGLFPAELGPETRSNGSGSKNGAERTQN